MMKTRRKEPFSFSNLFERAYIVFLVILFVFIVIGFARSVVYQKDKSAKYITHRELYDNAI